MENRNLTPAKVDMESKTSEYTIDAVAKVATASSMAMTTSFCMERKFLNNLCSGNSCFSLYKRTEGNCELDNVRWIQIKQIGKPVGNDVSAYFSALQNILRTCDFPGTRLLFLVLCKKRSFKIFLGLNGADYVNYDDTDRVIREVNAFFNVSWPGTKTEILKDNDLGDIKSFVENRYSHAYAFTGIPSIDLQESDYPSTIEFLMGGQHPRSDMAYLVIADPIKEAELSQIGYELDEIRGQAESFKSFNFSIANQEGCNESESEALTKTINETINEGKSQKNVAGTMLAIGVGLAAAIAFPPAGAVAAAGVGSALAGGSAAMLGSMAAGMVGAFVPQHTHSTSKQTGKSESHTRTQSYSQSYTQTLGQTLVNGHIETLVEDLKKHTLRYAKGRAQGMWNVSCYLFTDKENVSSQIQLKSLLCGQMSRLEPIRIHDISNQFKKRCISPFITEPDFYVVSKGEQQPFKHPLGTRFSSLSTPLTTEELTCMVNLPLHSVPGISVVDALPEFRLDTLDSEEYRSPVELGHLLYRGEETDIRCQFELNNLTRHSLVCGTNGSGKTNSVLTVLNSLNRHELNFMVIEPAKTEYVDWAISYNEQLEADQKQGKRMKEEPIVIYMPGKKSYWHCDKDGQSKEYQLKDILKLNPFEPVCLDGQEPGVQAHMDRIKSIFALAFPMEDILPTVMESLIRDVYTNGEKWLNRSKNVHCPELYPTLGLMSCRIKPVVLGLGYEPRVTGNIYAALNLRLSNLLSGWKRELLNNEVLGGYKKLSKSEEREGVKRPTWDDFFNRKVVVNLSGISDDADRTFIMGLLLLYLYEYRIAVSETPQFNFNQNELRHLMVVEEAHRVMMNNPNPDSPQYKCGLLFSNLLSEIRAYGQGIMVVDQIPSRLIPDAIKNTNMKIIHKLLSSDDVEMVADAMGVNAEQRKIIPKLSVGQAIVAGMNTGNVSNNNEEDIYWCKINKTK